MTTPQPVARLLLAAAVLSAGCTSGSHQAGTAGTRPAPPSLATSLAGGGESWAVTLMGGSAAAHNNFWQLLTRPAGGGRWRLVTPPGVASNGGLVAAPAGPRSLVAAFRPSQSLVFTPLATTADAGANWSPGVLGARLANVPGALAAAPGGGRLLALLASGNAELSAHRGTGWSAIATRRSLAATAAGRRCGLGELTAAAFSPTGQPMLAGSCTRPGSVGIFARHQGRWVPAGPAPPAGRAALAISVLRLASTASGTVALLATGSGAAARLTAAWTGGDGHSWAFSPALPLHGARVFSVSIGSSGSLGLVLSGGRGEILTGPGASWHPLPPLPRWTQTLALGPAQTVQALAGHKTILSVWAESPAAPGWGTVQTLHVPVQYGSSG